jgi:tRNA N6-adenosine threonylcarbamoyltransferase
MSFLTLGIETSCDETAVAVVEDGTLVRSNIILSQAEHSVFGGVVPEIASRKHVSSIGPIFQQALLDAEVTLKDIDLIAVTRGPGLIGCLLVGLNFARGLALVVGKPFVAVNHLEGHIAANSLACVDLDSHHLTLLISGGHTMLVEVLKIGDYRALGETRDDAVGEAFDKVAKLVGLGYPGGARIDKLAKSGNPQAIQFPRPMRKSGDYDFSFSGLKTAVALHWNSLSEEQQQNDIADIVASFQEAAVDILAQKTIHAAEALQVGSVTLAGGVAANSRLRLLLAEKLEKRGINFHYPQPDLCTDNAAMIAAAGYFQYRLRGASSMAVDSNPALRLGQ